MKPINFVGPVQPAAVPYEFSKRAYAYESDIKGNAQLELECLKRITLSARRRISIFNSYTNIAGISTR